MPQANWSSPSGGGGSSATDSSRIRSTRYYEISAGTTATITPPTNSNHVADDFGGLLDAVVSTMSGVGGKPTRTSARTAAGVIVTATWDGSTYTLSAAPSAYPVALIYRVWQTLTDFDSTASDILGEVDVEKQDDNPKVQTLELGGVADTTLSRSSAGVAAIEGSALLMASNIGVSVQAYDADLTTLGAGGSGARDFLGLGTANTPQFARLGLGVAADSGMLLYVSSGSPGTITNTSNIAAWSSAGNTQIAIQAPDASRGFLVWQHASNDQTAYIGVKQSDGSMQIATDLAAGNIQFYTGSNTLAGTIEADQDWNLVGKLGVGITPAYKLHVYTASAGTVAASASADEVKIENSGDCGITLASPDASETAIFFSSPTTTGSYGGRIRWGYDTGFMDYIVNKSGAGQRFYTNAADKLTMTMTSAGEVTMPLQPSFLARNSGTETDATGDGTEVDVDFDTEVFDRGGDFASDVFTAPVTGLYMLGNQVFLQQVGALHTSMAVKITTSNRTYNMNFNAANLRDGSNNQFAQTMAQLADMDSGDTAKVQLTVSGSTKTVDIFGGTGPDTCFWGYLVA